MDGVLTDVIPVEYHTWLHAIGIGHMYDSDDAYLYESGQHQRYLAGYEFIMVGPKFHCGFSRGESTYLVLVCGFLLEEAILIQSKYALGFIIGRIFKGSTSQNVRCNR